MKGIVKTSMPYLTVILIFCCTAVMADVQREVSDQAQVSPTNNLLEKTLLQVPKNLSKQSLGIAGDGNTPGALIAHSWAEVQHHGSTGRMIDWRSPYPQIQMAYSQIAVSDGIKTLSFNLFDPVNGTWPLGSDAGCEVTSSSEGWAGYTNLDVDPLGRAVITGHAMKVDTDPYRTTVFIDTMPPHGSYCDFGDSSQVPDIISGYGAVETGLLLWPKLEYHVYGSDTAVYAFSYESTTGGLGAITLFRKTGSDLSGTWEAHVIDTVDLWNQDVTASRVSTRAACCWLKYPEGGVANSNDVWYLISDDMGATWDLNNRVNVTDYLTNGGSYLGWLELSCLFDTDDHLHIVWNAHYYDGSTSIYFRCRLYHWAEHTDSTTSVHWSGYLSTCGHGGYNVLDIGKFTISECDGKLYVIWVQWGEDNVYNDCASSIISPETIHARNGEIHLAVSPNLDGIYWDDDRNLTNTVSHGCDNTEGNECANENWPSMSRYGMNINDPNFPALTGWDPDALTVDPSRPPDSPYTGEYFLDVMYVNDLIPGGSAYGQGDISNNPIKWFRLPCVEPELSDLDEDGVFDVLDNCVLDYNPGQEDSDNDGTGDACCCVGIRGDADCSGDFEPDISDITRLIDYLYISHEVLCCPNEADTDASGGEPDISDITRLIDFLYISHNPMAECP